MLAGENISRRQIADISSEAMRIGGDRNWQQMEWPGWFFEFEAISLFKGLFSLHADLPEEQQTGLDAFNEFPLDLKTRVNKNVKSAGNKWTILNDKRRMDDIFTEFGHLSFLVVSGDAEFGNIQKEYLSRIRAQLGKKISTAGPSGRANRARKDSFSPTSLSYFSFSARDWADLQKVGAVKIYNQGKQLNGDLRNLKYQVEFSRIYPTARIDF